MSLAPRLRLATVVMIICLAASIPGSTSVGDAPSEFVHPHRSRAAAERLVATIRHDGPARALMATLEAQGLTARAHPSRRVATPSGLDDGLAEPAASLLGAIQTAEDLRALALADLTPIERDALAGGLTTPVAGAATPRPAQAVFAVLETPSTAPHPLAAQIAAKVDERALRDAALTLLVAIEHAAPALAALPALPLAPSGCGAEGDMAFESGDCRVMIGGQDANVYGPGVDPDLLIDLGGEDTYTNGAARADGNVRVVLDLGGNDTYLEKAADDQPGAATLLASGQAVGTLGVGVLVDLGGDDSYAIETTATAPEPGPVARRVQASGQGAGIGGAGVLVDVGGNANTFTADASSSGGPASTLAQGQASVGLGALLSLGAPEDAQDDVYTATATSTLHMITKTTGFEQFSLGTAKTVAHGASDITGAGVLIDSAGADVYEAHAQGSAANTVAQGAGVAGVGILIDSMGNDSYAARAIGDATLSLITTDPNLCWRAKVIVVTAATQVVGHGSALSGAGVLIDGEGDDERSLEARSSAEAITEASSQHDCTQFGGVSAAATARSGGSEAIGQGAAAVGAGALVDLGGDDRDAIESASSAVARAIATSPGPNIETADATAGSALSCGQGFTIAGVALLADFAGDDQRIISAGTTEVEETSAGATTASAPGVAEAHGWVDSLGRAWFVDVGGDDTYLTDPAGASAAANDTCWSNTPDGRGIDIEVTLPLPAGCP